MPLSIRRQSPVTMKSLFLLGHGMGWGVEDPRHRAEARRGAQDVACVPEIASQCTRWGLVSRFQALRGECRFSRSEHHSTIVFESEGAASAACVAPGESHRTGDCVVAGGSSVFIEAILGKRQAHFVCTSLGPYASCFTREVIVPWALQA